MSEDLHVTLEKSTTTSMKQEKTPKDITIKSVQLLNDDGDITEEVVPLITQSFS